MQEGPHGHEHRRRFHDYAGKDIEAWREARLAALVELLRDISGSAKAGGIVARMSEAKFGTVSPADGAGLRCAPSGLR